MVNLLDRRSEAAFYGHSGGTTLACWHGIVMAEIGGKVWEQQLLTNQVNKRVLTPGALRKQLGEIGLHWIALDCIVWHKGYLLFDCLFFQ
jgi:hypothetical protein